MTQAQTLLTVTAPMNATGRQGRLLAEQISSDLKGLGNPASDTVRAALDKTCRIHFMSVCAVSPTQPDEHATLIIEATGDGERADVIRAIDTAIGDQLFPIIARACGLSDRRDLSAWMRKNTKTLSGKTPIGSRISGRSFTGIEDFTVPQIWGYNEIANQARKTVLSQPASGTHRPLAILHSARAAITDPELKALIDERVGRQGPGYVDRFDSPWIKAAAKRLQRQGKGSPLGIIANIIRIMPLIIWIGFAMLYLLSFLTVFYVLQLSLAKNISFVPEPLLAGVSGAASFVISAFLALIPSTVTAAFLFWLFRRVLAKTEARNTPDDSDPDPAIVAQLLATENPPNRPGKDQWVQNHMFSVTEIQGGFFRRYIVLPFAFRFIKRTILSSNFRKGFLNDMGTVHFARWLVPPDTNKLVFFSNYDGSWESYFEDFIVKAADGVTAIWGNAKGFPRVRMLLGEGATDADRFKRFARRSMVPTPFWYAAYPEISAEQVRKNGLFVHGLANIESMSHAETWVAMHGSRPRPQYDVEREEIQSLTFGNCANLASSKVYALRLPDNAGSGANTAQTAAQLWLTKLLDKNLTFGRRRPNKRAHYLALSMSGLERLGLKDAPKRPAGTPPDCAIPVHGLPTAFVQGMHHAGRQRLLQDPAENGWVWGSHAAPVDAVLLTYWDTAADGKKLHAEHMAQFQEYGITVVERIDTRIDFYAAPNSATGTSASPSAAPPPQATEPFGFADGVSQPRVNGLTKKGRPAPSIHDVEAGEFVLGYRDNLGYFPSTPTISGCDDAQDILPSTPAELPHRWPNFGGPVDQKEAARDFGRNGTFLVIRQLMQDVQKFDDFVDDVVNNQSIGGYVNSLTTAGSNVPSVDHEWVRSRLMGRWSNGSSVVLNPDRPATHQTVETAKADNEFLFGKDDPQGLSCPLGAHVRRANPRDGLNPQSRDEIVVTNRHRLLRRGRTYEVTHADGTKEVGTMFMCLNADIERQFEFVQQTWLNGETFHGLVQERDPIAASSGGAVNDRPGKTFDYSVPTPRVTAQIKGLSAFVELRGGGYFFLPSRRSIEFLCYI